MDKQDYREIIRGIKKGFEEKDYTKAIAFARELPLRKIKEVSVLEMIADSYMKLKKPKAAKEALEVAYSKNPNGKYIVHKLAMLAIKTKDIDSAVQYYEDFCRIAPNDNQRLIIKYKIAKAGGLSNQDKIKILEAYCAEETDDKWMFELAELYHEVGDGDKCASMCDEIILWFAESDYLKKALELKFSHKALTATQQAMYEQIMHEYIGGPSEPEETLEVVPEENPVPTELDEEAEEFANRYLKAKGKKEFLGRTKPIDVQGKTEKRSNEIKWDIPSTVQIGAIAGTVAQAVMPELEEAEKAAQAEKQKQEEEKAKEEMNAASDDVQTPLEEPEIKEPALAAVNMVKKEYVPDVSEDYEKHMVVADDGQLELDLDLLGAEYQENHKNLSIEQLFNTYKNNIENNESNKNAVAKVEAERLRQIQEAVANMLPDGPKLIKEDEDEEKDLRKDAALKEDADFENIMDAYADDEEPKAAEEENAEPVAPENEAEKVQEPIEETAAEETLDEAAPAEVSDESKKDDENPKEEPSHLELDDDIAAQIIAKVLGTSKGDSKEDADSETQLPEDVADVSKDEKHPEDATEEDVNDAIDAFQDFDEDYDYDEEDDYGTEDDRTGATKVIPPIFASAASVGAGIKGLFRKHHEDDFDEDVSYDNINNDEDEEEKISGQMEIPDFIREWKKRHSNEAEETDNAEEGKTEETDDIEAVDEVTEEALAVNTETEADLEPEEEPKEEAENKSLEDNQPEVKFDPDEAEPQIGKIQIELPEFLKKTVEDKKPQEPAAGEAVEEVKEETAEANSVKSEEDVLAELDSLSDMFATDFASEKTKEQETAETDEAAEQKDLDVLGDFFADFTAAKEEPEASVAEPETAEKESLAEAGSFEADAAEPKELVVSETEDELNDLNVLGDFFADFTVAKEEPEVSVTEPEAAEKESPAEADSLEADAAEPKEPVASETEDELNDLNVLGDFFADFTAPDEEPETESKEPADSEPEAESEEPDDSEPEAESEEPAVSEPEAESEEPAVSEPEAETAALEVENEESEAESEEVPDELRSLFAEYDGKSDIQGEAEALSDSEFEDLNEGESETEGNEEPENLFDIFDENGEIPENYDATSELGAEIESEESVFVSTSAEEEYIEPEIHEGDELTIKFHDPETGEEIVTTENLDTTQPMRKIEKYTLTDELREELAEFLLKEGMEEEICDAITAITALKRSGDETGGNLIITGDPKSGKTFLAISIIKAVAQDLENGSGKVAKVQAEAINGKNVATIFKKIKGNDLLIENVGLLEDETIEQILEVMKNGRTSDLIVIEGNVLAVETMINNYPEIEDLFKSRVDIEELTISDWADVACDYAQHKGYKVDDMALLALHAKIDETNQPTSRFGYKDVVKIMEDAMQKSEKRNTGKLFSAFNKKDESMSELTEADFM